MKTNQHGFTLVELMIGMTILSFISLLGYIVLASSMEASRVADAQVQLQGNLRGVMQAISAEVRSAYSERSISPQNTAEISLIDTEGGIPPTTIKLTVSADSRTITFQKPVPTTTKPIPQPSTVITIGLQCEDAGFSSGNGILDTGEDANGDGMLTRRVNRTQDGVAKPIGSVNDISDIAFTLMPSDDTGDKNKTVLKVRLVSSKLVGIKKRLVKADLEGRIHLEN